MASEVIVTPSCIAAMNCGGSPVILQYRPRAAVALALELPDARAARGDEAVLGRDEEPFSRIRPRRASSFERNGHAPRGARLDRDGSSSKLVRMVSEPPDDERVFYAIDMRAEYRIEPCRSALNRVKGMPFNWSLNPYMGCVHRCTFCYVRAFEQRADRPCGDGVRHLDPRQGEHRRGAAARARTAVVAGREHRDRRRHRSLSAGRGALPPHPRLPRGARSAANPFGLITRGPMIVRDARRAGRGGAARGGLGHLLGSDARRRGLAADRARNRAAAPAAAGAREARRRRDPRLGRDGADPARHLGPARSSSPRSSGPRATRARAGSGRTCSTCGRARASTSSGASPGTGPSSLPEYERLYAAAPTFPNADASRCATRARARPPPRRRRPPPRAARAAAAQPEQLTSTCGLTCRRMRSTDAAIQSLQVRQAEEITALIVDDHEVVREGLRLSLSRAPHIRVVGEAVRRRRAPSTWRSAASRTS